jgi:hypothetical protein
MRRSVVVVLLLSVATATMAAVTGDIDGDGLRDSLSLAWAPDGAQLRTFCDEEGSCGERQAVKLVARLSRLGVQRVRVPVEIRDARILGVVDVDRDGSGEVFLEVAHGASTALFTVLRIVDGRLTPMSIGVRPARFSLGGSVTHFGTVGCTRGALVIETWGTDWTRASATFTVYRFDGARLVVERRHNFEWTCTDDVSCETSPELEAAGFDRDCPDIPFN